MVREMTVAALLCAAPAAAQTFAVDPAASTATIEVGKAGLFSFAAGHVHEVRGPIENGTVELDAQNPSRSKVDLIIATRTLKVTGKGDPPDDVPKVEAAMQGEKVLDVARYPRITFRSTSATGVSTAAAFDATVAGTLTIRDKSQPVTVKVHVQKTASALTATGQFSIKQTAFGIQPISVAGVVKVEDELKIAFRIVANIKGDRE